MRELLLGASHLISLVSKYLGGSPQAPTLAMNKNLHQELLSIRLESIPLSTPLALFSNPARHCLIC